MAKDASAATFACLINHQWSAAASPAAAWMAGLIANYTILIVYPGGSVSLQIFSV